MDDDDTYDPCAKCKGHNTEPYYIDGVEYLWCRDCGDDAG